MSPAAATLINRNEGHCCHCAKLNGFMWHTSSQPTKHSPAGCFCGHSTSFTCRYYTRWCSTSNFVLNSSPSSPHPHFSLSYDKCVYKKMRWTSELKALPEEHSHRIIGLQFLGQPKQQQQQHHHHLLWLGVCASISHFDCGHGRIMYSL